MDLVQLRQILDLVREHELSEFEMEHEGLRLRVRKDVTGAATNWTAPPTTQPAVVAPGPSPLAPPARDESDGLTVVKSPIVGTFYRAPEPTASPFVEIGTVVKKGQVLCIIEAMKMMNEIDSEHAGEIVRIYVENGQPVQYGERLFAIKTA